MSESAIGPNVWIPRLEMKGSGPHLAYSPRFGLRVVRFETGKGICNCDVLGESIENWFGCTHVMKITLPDSRQAKGNEEC